MHALSNFLIPLYLSAPSVCTLHVYRNLYDYVKRFTNCPRPMNRYDLPGPHHDIHCVPKPLVVKSLVCRIKRTVNIRIGSSRPLFARPAPPPPILLLGTLGPPSGVLTWDGSVSAHIFAALLAFFSGLSWSACED